MSDCLIDGSGRFGEWGYARFLLFNAAGCAVWATIFVLLGTLVGENRIVIAHWIARGGTCVLAILLAAVAALQWRHRKSGAPAR
jgi:membrane protein DedA with SNARE-associated domain